MKAVDIRIRGIVQGVGFRPFVCRLATHCRVRGGTYNDTEGVVVRAEGDDDDVDRFVRELSDSAPPLAVILSIEVSDAHPAGAPGFVIEASRPAVERLAFYSPDVAMCDRCRVEFFDPGNRRHLYPFITCIDCGPRFSIVRDIPYDRDTTSMAPFVQCDRCLAEYRDREDRRFHSQPNACPACGPRMTLRGRDGEPLTSDPPEVARRTLGILKEGGIVAIKGMGGYHLAVDAMSDDAVRELRARKRRPFKPFAVMAGSIESAGEFAVITPLERGLLLSKERPIVLVRERRALLGRLVAPGLSYIGLMLPCTPFQHHLFDLDPDMVLVMTSGNISEEPIEYRDDTIIERLGGVADHFVTYDREIIGQGDDSVIFVSDGRPFFIRRSRGFIPVPFLSTDSPSCIFAAGGDMKNSFAIARKHFIIMSQYLGDMEDPLTWEAYRTTAEHFIRVFDAEPRVVAADMHPGYHTRRYAGEMALTGMRMIEVQHHHAHVASVMEEHGLEGPVIGIAFDGTGYGTDGTLWGSEFLVARREGFERAAHYSNFPLPGGERAIHDVWRIGLSLLHGRYGRAYPVMPRDEESEAVLEIIEKNLNSPLTCSIGRLFDGVAAILGLCRSASAEAEAAQLLEEAASRGRAPSRPHVPDFETGEGLIISTGDLVGYLVSLIEAGTRTEDVAAAFHVSIIHTAAAVALRIREQTGITSVALSGGVFHNRILLTGLARLLPEKGFGVYLPRDLPCNDGCIAHGQLVVAKALLKEGG
ncbi:MAG: carbamoyltransferase HypF [Spirochaetes bacterium]|nr:carbamoyltransferase HypF [Spirochaetota bacterium]